MALCLRIASSGMSLNAEKGRVNRVAGDKDVLEDRPEPYDAMRCRLQKKHQARRGECDALATASSKLASLCCNTTEVDKELSVAQTNAELQSLLHKKSHKQLVAEPA